jgi:hypothetical protein
VVATISSCAALRARVVKGCVRQVNAMIVSDLGSAKRGFHHTRIAASNVQKVERKRKNVVEGLSEDSAYLAVGQAIVFDQLAVGGPLLLELGERRGVHHCAAGLAFTDVNVHQGRCPSPN